MFTNRVHVGPTSPRPRSKRAFHVSRQMCCDTVSDKDQFPIIVRQTPLLLFLTSPLPQHELTASPPSTHIITVGTVRYGTDHLHLNSSSSAEFGCVVTTCPYCVLTRYIFLFDNWLVRSLVRTVDTVSSIPEAT